MCASCVMIEWSFPSGRRNWRELIPGRLARRIVTLILLSCAAALALPLLTMLQQEITLLTETRTLYAILAVRLSTAINPSNLEAVRRQKTAKEQDLWKSQIAGFTPGCLPAAYLPTTTSFRTEEEEGIPSRALPHNELHHDLVSSPFFSSRQSRKLPRE